MADLTVASMFRLNTGAAATGLVLGEIDLWLTEQNRATGVDAVIWNGAENPTEEMDNTGAYIRIYALGDFDVNNYYAAAHYTGVTVLETDYVQGAVGLTEPPIGTAIAFTYTVTDSVTLLPVEGVEVWVSTDLAGDNIVWYGVTDAFGVARDRYDFLPRLDPGTYYFWKQRVAYIDDQNPDIEVVS